MHANCFAETVKQSDRTSILDASLRLISQTIRVVTQSVILVFHKCLDWFKTFDGPLADVCKWKVCERDPQFESASERVPKTDKCLWEHERFA